MAACRSANDDYQGEAVQAACQAAETAVVAVLDNGYDVARMQIALDWWSEAVDGPRIEVQVLASPSAA